MMDVLVKLDDIAIGLSGVAIITLWFSYTIVVKSDILAALSNVDLISRTALKTND
jgi:hypothetical protein